MYKTKIIPTPKTLEYKNGKKEYKSPVKFFAEDFKLDFVIDFFKRQSGISAHKGEGTPSECDVVASLSKDLPAQNYILESKEGSPVSILAGDYTGFLYAVSTLIQLVADGELCNVYIKDSPDFLYRANNWCCFVEMGILSYDYGNGREALYSHLIKKLDMCLLYKINMVYIDGFNWNANREPGYAHFHRKLNDEARKRGIRLCYGGFSMSYSYMGANNLGKTFYNTDDDGNVYNCIGKYDNITKNTLFGTNGTCLSNQRLTEEKMAELREFVRLVHPGALYIHGADANFMFPELWKQRCENCRKRWPSDDLNAKDGAAGAFAEFYDRIIAEVSSVKDADFSGAETLVLNVGPGYIEYPEIEYRGYDNYVKTKEYWHYVDKFMKKTENGFVTHREAFFDPKTNRLFYEEEMPLRKNANVAIISFSGAEGFYSDKLYHTTALMNYLMKGAPLLIMACGNSFREPLQLTNAEYMWNSRESAFCNLEKPKDYDEFWRIYKMMQETSFRPDGIYAEGGLLHQCCIKLYGEKAGGDMYELYSMHGENYQCPMLFPSNTEVFTSLRYLREDYQKLSKGTLKAEEAVQFEKNVEEISILTDRANKILNKVLAEKAYKPENKDDLEFMSLSSEYCTKLIRILCKYIKLFKNKNAEDCDRLKLDLEALKAFALQQQRKPVDVFGGALLDWQKIPDIIKIMVDKFKEEK